MNFNNFDYKRPELEEINKSFTAAIKQFAAASDADQAKAIFSKIATIRSEFTSMYSIAHIRHTVDTKDDFYEKEQTYFDTNMPSYQDLVTQFYKALLQTPYRDAIEGEWGGQLFVIAELSLKVFDAKVLEDLKKKISSALTMSRLKLLPKLNFVEKNITYLDLFL